MPEHLEGLDGLIIPGGESTTIGKLAVRWGLVTPLQELLATNWPVWGTCAGLIFLARDVVGALPDQVFLEAMDIRVQRNAFGSQRESFEIDLNLPVIGQPPFHAVFIRAPADRGRGAGRRGCWRVYRMDVLWQRSRSTSSPPPSTPSLPTTCGCTPTSCPLPARPASGGGSGSRRRIPALRGADGRAQRPRRTRLSCVLPLHIRRARGADHRSNARVSVGRARRPRSASATRPRETPSDCAAAACESPNDWRRVRSSGDEHSPASSSAATSGSNGCS